MSHDASRTPGPGPDPFPFEGHVPRRARLTGWLAIWALAFSASSAVGQQPASPASSIQTAAERLGVGQLIRLDRVGSTDMVGTLTGTSTTGLVLTQNGTPATVPFDDIRQLSVQEHDSGAGPAIGAVLGVLTGALLGDLTARLRCDCGDNTPSGDRIGGAVVGGVALGAVGTLTGYLIGHSTRWRVVFP